MELFHETRKKEVFMVKVLSAVTAAYVFVTYCLANVFKDSFMPMLFGADLLAGILKLGLVVGLIYLANRTKFKYKFTVQTIGTIGIGVLLFGILGMMSVDLEYVTYPYLMSMDYVTLAETGILFCLASLTYKYRTNKLPKAVAQFTPPRQLAQMGLAHSNQVLQGFVESAKPKRATSLSQRRTRLAS
jgi:hypothetical protein